MGIDGARSIFPLCEATRLIVLEKECLTGETIAAAGAVSVSTPVSYLATTGAIAITLADGLEGQRKVIVMMTDGGDATLTPASFANGTNITFDNYDSWEGLFVAGNWYSVGTPTAAVA